MAKKDAGKNMVKRTIDYFSDPAGLVTLNKESLIKLCEATEDALEQLTAQRVAVRAELLDKIDGDGEVIGKKAYTKIKIYNYDIELEKAKELGATKIVPEKEVIDNATLKKLVIKGVKIKHTITDRLMIRNLK